MNLAATAGVALIVLGVIIFAFPNLINYLVALAFVVGGLFLAMRGFGMMRG
ncbi:MAG: hypothetical protein WKH64_18525 [Chloroflexia bacterium]